MATAVIHQPVVGISHAPARYLPSTLLTTADAHIKITVPRGLLLHKLLREFCRIPHPSAPSRRCPRLVSTFGRSWPLSEVAASARAVLDNLASTRAAKVQTGQIDDVPLLHELAGYGSAASWGLDLAEHLNEWRSGAVEWSSLSASAVLAGPPGVGKTLFARSLARTCCVPLVATSVGAWFAQSDGHLGDVIKAAQSSFDEARALRPSVLLIDELDGLPDRRSMDQRGRDWWTPVVNHILTLLDGAATDRTGVIVVGTTNHADRLDPALVRSGRLDRVIEIGFPDATALAVILRQQCSADELRDVSDDALIAIAEATWGASGADAVHWMRDARVVARTHSRSMTLDDLQRAVLPLETRSAKDLLTISVHEAGHALVARACGQKIKRLSIVPNGDAGGYSEVESTIGVTPSRSEFEVLIIGALAGRAAEEVIIGHPSTGAEADLERSTRLVAMLHTSLGLGATLLHRVPSADVPSVLAIDPNLRRDVEADLRQLYNQAVTSVHMYRHEIEAVAAALRVRRILTAADVEAIIERGTSETAVLSSLKDSVHA